MDRKYWLLGLSAAQYEKVWHNGAGIILKSYLLQLIVCHVSFRCINFGLKFAGNDDEDLDKRVLSPLGLTVLSCKAFLLFSALFLLQVASISKSNGAKSPAEVLPRIQEAS